MNFVILISYYFVLLLSLIGYGYCFSKICLINLNRYNFSVLGILGIIFLTFISYLTNLFVSHNFAHNVIVHIVGISIFIFLFRKKLFCTKKFLKFITILFTIFCLCLLAKAHDDFGWYHLPYTLNISQNKFQFGLGTFNHGFKTPSSLFYTNSLFYLPGINYFSFNFTQLFIFSFSIIYFFKKILTSYKNNNVIFFFSTFSLIFVSIVFYRLGEHGTDRSGQILLFIIITLIIEFIYSNKINYKKLYLILILGAYIITIKTYFVIYTLLLLPLIFYIRNDFQVYQKILKSRVVVFILCLLPLSLLTQFASTGCFLFPLKFSCHLGLDWSLNENTINYLSRHYELWSKAGANPNNFNLVDDKDLYISGVNWVANWTNTYFFNKVSDLLLGILAIILLSFIFFFKKSEKDILKNQSNVYTLFLSLLIILLIWFFKFPQLRYGGFVILASVVFLPFSYFILNFKLNKKLLISSKCLIAIAIVIFVGRNIDRIIKETKIYNYKPLGYSFFRLEKHNFSTIDIGEGITLNLTEGSCWSTNQPCSHRNNIKAKKKYGYIIYYE